MEYALVFRGAYLLAGAYLLGSISWGLILGRLRRGIDLRQVGSGGTGATNVLRTMGPRMAAVVLFADMAKGVTAVALAKLLADDIPMIVALASILVIVGHIWPVFSRFHGGRGIATAVGALVMISLPTVMMATVAFIPAVAITRYVSLGSLLAVATSMIMIPVLSAAGEVPWEYTVFSTVGGPMILWRHRENIKRLLNGTERRMSFRRGQPSGNK